VTDLTTWTRPATALFLVASLLYGLPYLLIKIGLEGLDPLTIVWIRAVVGAMILSTIAWRLGQFAPLRGRLGDVVLVGLANSAIASLLLTLGEQHVTSSLTGLLTGAQPLIVAVMAIWVDHSERASRSQTVGLVVGLVGLACVLGLDPVGEGVTAGGILLVIGAATAFSVGALLIKSRLVGLPAIGASAGMVIVSSIVFIPLVVIEPIPGDAPAGSILAALGLGSLAAVALLCYVALIDRVGAAKGSLITYVSPVVAMFAGFFVLGESITLGMMVGFVLIVIGSVVAARQPRPRPALASGSVDAEEISCVEP
jgi:drug/metabolite transporter (DMT)-like permease